MLALDEGDRKKTWARALTQLDNAAWTAATEPDDVREAPESVRLRALGPVRLLGTPIMLVESTGGCSRPGCIYPMENANSQEAVDAAMADVNRALPTLTMSPHVSELQVELAVDSNGRDAAFITVVLDDEPSGDLYPWTRLQPIHDLIWKKFTERALARWPYIEFRQKSEVEGEPDEPEAKAG